MGVMMTCQTHNDGTFDTQDRVTLLNGWIAYRALPANSGGPFLAGLSETVFCTSEASCLTVGINNGAGEIWGQANNWADDDTATFNGH
ncbi:MAG: hypothetical protein ALECFALPRED_001577, partial [Alectoria fallacina]